MNKDEFELLKRRLSDEVKADVRGQLFGTYALVGTAVIAALGYANWNFLTKLQEDSTREFNVVIEEARGKSGQLAAEIEATLSKQITELKTSVDKQSGRLEYETDRVGTLLAKVSEQLGSLDVEASKLTNLNQTVRLLSEANREIQAGLIKVEERTNQLSTLAEELKRLARATEETTVSSRGVAASVASRVATVQSAAKSIADSPTVYLQFAGGARETAVELSESLARMGYILPRGERTPLAASKREVRYFFEEDKEKAQKLVEATTVVLGQLGQGVSPKLTARLLESSKATAGNLELWIELK